MTLNKKKIILNEVGFKKRDLKSVGKMLNCSISYVSSIYKQLVENKTTQNDLDQVIEKEK